MHGKHGLSDRVGRAAQLGGHGVSYCEMVVAQSTKITFVELGKGHERVVPPASAGKDRPAVVVPVNYELAVAQVADQTGNGESWDAWRVLNKYPLRRRKVTGE